MTNDSEALEGPPPFDYDAPLPPLNIRPQNKLWEPAAVHYRNLETK